MGVSQEVPCTNEWSDASCSEYPLPHCHQAIECFETIINLWQHDISLMLHIFQSCHHLSPWLWCNSEDFLGVESRKNRDERRKCPGRQLGLQRVANAQGRSHDTPDMESWRGSLVICWDLWWLGDNSLAETPCITLWPTCQESSNEFCWREWADRKCVESRTLSLMLFSFAQFLQDLAYRPLALMFGLLCPGVKRGDLAFNGHCF